MIVKRFQAATVSDAMKKVKEEWGENAVILNTRKIRCGGFLGLFRKDLIEVTAAIDEVPQTSTRRLNKPAAAVERRDQRELGELRREIQRTQELVRQLVRHLEEEKVVSSSNDFAQELVARGLSTELLPDLLKSDEGQQLTWQQVAKNLERRISPYVESGGKGRVIALVGPTGAGKTTTLAKLAAAEVLTKKNQVAFITFDTYRVSAVEQLKTYADILGAPIDVVCTPQELQQAIARFSDKSRILIDTVGRSHQNIMQLSEMRSFIEAAQPDEVHLTISVTTDQSVMYDIVEAYSEIPITHLLFTKLDEAQRFGSVINMLGKYDLPVAYLTNGQNVPEDIVTATTEFVTKLFLGDKL